MRLIFKGPSLAVAVDINTEYHISCRNRKYLGQNQYRGSLWIVSSLTLNKVPQMTKLFKASGTDISLLYSPG